METITLSKKRKNLIMLGLTLSVLLAALDSTVVATAMKQISDDLKGLDLYTWPLTIYLLLSTIITPISGKLADTFGRKNFFIIGTVIFLTGSVLCGISQSMFMLIAFRGIQGIGGGILMSNTFAMIGDIFPPSERAKNTGIVFSAFGLASVIGPVLGGTITDQLSWRWVFYINLPIGIVFLILILLTVPTIEHTSNIKVDYLGTITLIIGLTPMLLGFTLAGDKFPWLSAQIIGLFIFSVIILSLFVVIESKAEEPILPLTLFRNRTYLVSILSASLSNATMFGAVLFVPLYVQVVLERNATVSGLTELPMMLGFVIASAISGQAISKTGRLKPFAVSGFVLTALGVLLLTSLHKDSSLTLLAIAMSIAGIGIGVNMPVFTLAVQNVFPQSKMGVVTASVQFFRSIGGTIASAIFGTIMLNSVSSGLTNIDLEYFEKALPAVDLKSIINNPNSLTDLKTIELLKKSVPASSTEIFVKLLDQMKNVLFNSTHYVFIATLLIAISAIIISVFLPNLLVKNELSKQP